MKQVKIISKGGKPWEESLIKTTTNYIKDRLMDEELKNNEEVKNQFKGFDQIDDLADEPTIDNMFGIDTSRETINEYTKAELERCKDLKYFYSVYIVKRELTDIEENYLNLYLDNLNK